MAESRTPPKGTQLEPQQGEPLLQEGSLNPEDSRPKSALKHRDDSQRSSGRASQDERHPHSLSVPSPTEDCPSWGGYQRSLSSETNVQEEIGRFLDDANRKSDKMDLAAGFFSEQDHAAPRHHIDETDYDSHRSDDYQFVRPLSLKSRPSSRKEHGNKGQKSHKGPKKKHEVPIRSSSLPDVQEDTGQVSSVENVPPPSIEPDSVQKHDIPDVVISKEESPDKPDGKHGVSGTGGKVNFYIGDDALNRRSSELAPGSSPRSKTLLEDLMSDEEPHPSPVISTGSYPLEKASSQPSGPRVQFTLGSAGSSGGLVAEVEASSGSEDVNEKETPDEKPKRHHHRHRHVPSEKELARRRHVGSEVFLPDSLRRVPTEKDEAAMLAGADLDDMTSHRFSDARALRRRKI